MIEVLLIGAVFIAAVVLAVKSALAPRDTVSDRASRHRAQHVGGPIALLAFVFMAFGFGASRDKGDILHSPEHEFHLGTYKVGATATSVKTARLVLRSAAGKVQVAGDEGITAFGICRKRTLQASTGDRNPTYDRTTDFATDDLVEVARPRQGALVEVILKDGEVIVEGNIVVQAAAGEVKKYDPDVTATVNETTVEAALAEQASIVGRAMEAKSPSGASTSLLIAWGQH